MHGEAIKLPHVYDQFQSDCETIKVAQMGIGLGAHATGSGRSGRRHYRLGKFEQTNLRIVDSLF